MGPAVGALYIHFSVFSFLPICCHTSTSLHPTNTWKPWCSRHTKCSNVTTRNFRSKLNNPGNTNSQIPKGTWPWFVLDGLSLSGYRKAVEESVLSGRIYIYASNIATPPQSGRALCFMKLRYSIILCINNAKWFNSRACKCFFFAKDHIETCPACNLTRNWSLHTYNI